MRILLTCLLAVTTTIANPIAEWRFDEGAGNTAADIAGNSHDATIHGATWVRQGDGFAINLDGVDDYIDCGANPLGENSPVSIEAWIRPLRKAHGEASLMGIDMSSYILTYYNTELALLYINSGANNVRGTLRLDEWNHVAASFDGTNLMMWVNGRSTGRHPSKAKTYRATGNFIIGTKGRPDLPRFKGMVDSVRLYDRALTNNEAREHYRTEAEVHEIDPTWLEQPRFTWQPYPDHGTVVAEIDYSAMQPLAAAGRFDVSYASALAPENILQHTTIDPLPTRTGIVEVSLPVGKPADGQYILTMNLAVGEANWQESATIIVPQPPVRLPAPAAYVVPYVLPQLQNEFSCRVTRAGGLTITMAGRRYDVQTRVSWPHGDFNVMAARGGLMPGEEGWHVELRDTGAQHHVHAGGSFYTIDRVVDIRATHIYIKDTYTNTTTEDLGLLIYNEMPLVEGQLVNSLLSGYERIGRQAQLSYPDYGPSLFFTDTNAGFGFVPIDDVFTIQAMPYAGWNGAAGICTESFALAPGQAHTLEWAIYPTGRPVSAEPFAGGYYDFVNAFRTAENRIGTVTGTPGFITTTPHPPTRHEVPDKNYVQTRNLKFGFMHSLSTVADDRELHVEGIELFRDFPRELALMKQQIAETHAEHPNLKALQHIAHSLYCTNRPEQFLDSRVIVNGTHLSWGDGVAFGKEKQAAGWRWWVFYPTPGNSFHQALIDSIDVMMDDVGLDGGFMDGFLAGYGSMWTEDRWDGHTAVIDLQSKTILRKRGSVLLLSQPSMLAYARRVRAKGGVVAALHSVLTRSIAGESYIMFANESASGPEMHLAPTVMALGNNRGFNSEKAIYLDMLDKLQWGELYIHYTDGRPLTHASFASKQYPITFEEIRPGLVRGPERIVTSNSGAYHWPGDRRLHRVHKFDSRGVPVRNDCVTTVDPIGVRTATAFEPNESAVIVPIAAVLKTSIAVNVLVLNDEQSSLRMRLNGNGPATLQMQVNDLQPYEVVIGQQSTIIRSVVAFDKDRPIQPILSIPLQLAGETSLVIRPQRPGRAQ